MLYPYLRRQIRRVLAVSLGMSLIFLGLVQINFRELQRIQSIRHLESELRTSLLRMSFEFVSLASAPEATSFSRRSICQVNSDSLQSVIGASPTVFLPSSQVRLRLMDKEYFKELHVRFREANFSPSIPDRLSVSEKNYWAAFMRCQQNSTVYPTASETPIRDLNQVSSYYFCFHATSKSLSEIQPVIVETHYIPYNMDSPDIFPEKAAIPCRDFHDHTHASKRIGMLKYSLYWNHKSPTGQREFQETHRTYFAREN